MGFRATLAQTMVFNFDVRAIWRSWAVPVNDTFELCCVVIYVFGLNTVHPTINDAVRPLPETYIRVITIGLLTTEISACLVK